MPVQYTAQQLLDDIDRSGYSSLFSDEIPMQQRKASIKVVRQKIRLTKKALKVEQDAIKRRWDGRKSGEALMERMELAPYDLVSQNLDKVEISLAELDTALEYGNSTPEKVFTGGVLVGNDELGEYAIAVDEAAAQRWIERKNTEVDIMRHANRLSAELLTLGIDIDYARNRGKATATKLKKVQSINVLPLIFGSIMFMGLGAVMFQTTMNLALHTDVTALALVTVFSALIGFVGLGAAIYYMVRGKRLQIEVLKSQLREAKQEYHTLTNRMKQINQEIKQMQAQLEQAQSTD